MADSLSCLSDADLLMVAKQVLAAAGADAAAFGTSAAEVSALGALQAELSTNLNAQVAAQVAARAATAAKDASRRRLEAGLRKVQRVAKAVGASESKLESLGIPNSSAAAPSAATCPQAKVNTSERLRHTIEWKDLASQATRKKPRGTIGAEIWVKIGGTEPKGPSECTFLTLKASTPFLATFDGPDAGKMAHYMIRWRMRDGSTSGWGETVSATITG